MLGHVLLGYVMLGHVMLGYVMLGHVTWLLVTLEHVMLVLVTFLLATLRHVMLVVVTFLLATLEQVMIVLVTCLLATCNVRTCKVRMTNCSRSPIPTSVSVRREGCLISMQQLLFLFAFLPVGRNFRDVAFFSFEKDPRTTCVPSSNWLFEPAQLLAGRDFFRCLF